MTARIRGGLENPPHISVIAGELPDEANAELRLARIAEAALDRPIEIEDEVRHLGVLEVLAVEDVEDVERRLGGHAVREVERLRQPEVERRVLIVLASEVAARDRAVGIDAVLRRLRDRVEARAAESVLAAERIADHARQRLRLRGALR